MTLKKITHIFSVFLLLSASTLVAQAALIEIPLEQQIENSNLVVEGKVVSSKAAWDSDHKMIYTTHTVEVYKVFKGSITTNTIEVITVGGFVEDQGFSASHMLELHKGDTGMFTLHNSKITFNEAEAKQRKQFRAYSGIQGFYKYNSIGNNATNALKAHSNEKDAFYKEICDITKQPFSEVQALKSKNTSNTITSKSSANPEDISFSPTQITAGTGTVLTITGTDFGNTQGRVGFRDANDGGQTFVVATDIISWSNTTIEVEVPSDAGTGDIIIEDSNGTTATSTEILTVNYAHSNAISQSSGRTFFVQHINQNERGGYTFELESQFFNDNLIPGARAAFENAVEIWRCESKINWEVDDEPSSSTSTDDSSNLVAFSGGTVENLPDGTLGVTFSGYTAFCFNSPNFAVTSLDIVFNRNTNWFFGDGEIQRNEIDFLSVALHELGHAHQLGHVIDRGNLMHFASLSGTSSFSRELDENSINGANDMQDRSTSVQLCFTNIMTDYDGSCSLGVSNPEENIIADDTLKIFPNPASGQVFIRNDSNTSLDTISIYDLSGRRVLFKDLVNAPRTDVINLEGISAGVYIVTIAYNNTTITSKLAVE